MAIEMQPVRNAPGAVPSVIYGTYDAASAIVLGSIVYLASGLYTVAGTNPRSIAGVALQAKDTAPGFAAANNPNPITGRQTKIAVAVADTNTVFAATLTNGSSTRIAPAQADVGENYGVTAYTGVWTVDKAKTTAGTNTCINVVGIDTDRNLVYFKFLASLVEGP